MNDEEVRLLEYWKSNEGSFVIVDYISNKILSAAKGRLELVSPTGGVVIRHLKDPATSWSFNLFEVEIQNSKFSAVKGGG